MEKNTIWIGNDKRGSIWTKCWQSWNVNEYISENNISYWCHLRGYDLRICKDTNEGKLLSELINIESDGSDDIYNYLHQCMMKHMTVEQFISLLEEAYKDGCKEGKRKKILEIRNVLEINE